LPIRGWLLSTTAFAAFGASWVATVTTQAQAGDLSLGSGRQPGGVAGIAPAVEAFNAKWDAIAGSLADQTLVATRGSLSWPLGGQFGLQVDGLAGSYQSDFLGGAAAHLFWRDPSIGLLGVYADSVVWDHFGGLYASHVAVEGERYWGFWSVQGIAGVEFGNSQSNVSALPGVTTIDSFAVKTRFFDQIDLSYYLTDNLKLGVGHRYLGGKEAAAFTGEWAFPIGHGMMGSLIAEGFVGESNFHGVWGGLKVYFGPNDKPLISRHRRDDPNDWMPNALFTITNSHNTTSIPTGSPPAPPPPPPPPPPPVY
jgi:hypothetical protein